MQNVAVIFLFLGHYKTELEIRKNLGSDTTGARVKISQIYEKMGDTAAAARVLDEN